MCQQEVCRDPVMGRWCQNKDGKSTSKPVQTWEKAVDSSVKGACAPCSLCFVLHVLCSLCSVLPILSAPSMLYALWSMVHALCSLCSMLPMLCALCSKNCKRWRESRRGPEKACSAVSLAVEAGEWQLPTGLNTCDSEWGGCWSLGPRTNVMS